MGDLRNLKNPGVQVDLDKPRTIRYSYGSFEWLANKYGSVKNALAVFQDADGLTELSAKSMGAILDFAYAGLLHDREITRENLADWLDFESIKTLTEAIGMAIRSAMPQAKADAESPQ